MMNAKDDFTARKVWRTGPWFTPRFAITMAAVVAWRARGADSTTWAATPKLQVKLLASDFDRTPEAVSIAIDSTLALDIATAPGDWFFEEKIESGETRRWAAQLEGGDSPRLWWIPDGVTPAKTERTFSLEWSGIREETPPQAGLAESADALELRLGSDTAVRYQASIAKPPDGVDPIYARGGFLHPLTTPAGVIVTDVFPPEDDHFHQDGVWMAWTRTKFAGRTPDFWNLKGGTGGVRPLGIETRFEGPVFAGFASRHEMVDLSATPPVRAIDDKWDVRLWDSPVSEERVYVFDLASRQKCAGPEALELPEYLYGGLAVRGAREWAAGNCRFRTSEGQSRLDGNATRCRWVEMSGQVEGKAVGVCVLSHPDNFRAPQPVRLHPVMPYFCFAPSQMGDWKIEPKQELTLRYRFLVFDGELPNETIENHWRNFAFPPRVEAIGE